MNKEDLLAAVLYAAIKAKDDDMIHEVNGKIMGEILNDLMHNFETWCSKAGFLKGMYLAMAQLFVETIKQLCDEEDLAIANSLRCKTEITTVDLRQIKEQAKKQKQKDDRDG